MPNTNPITEVVIQPADPGSRPMALVNQLPASALKNKLASCAAGKFVATNFSIAHRGAPRGFPEHTVEGYQAAAAMGAGIIECDVTFTKDLALVCRHSQCDLHRTTNILATSLARQCSIPFTPASASQPAAAQCCTSDITLAEFKSLCGRADSVNPKAQTVQAYLDTPPPPLAQSTLDCGTLVTHAESIELLNRLGVEFTPELKSPMVDMPFNGMTQQQYATRMLEEYTTAGIPAARVHPQSFVFTDVLYWIDQHPEFAQQAVYLDPRGRQSDFKASLENMLELKQAGVKTLAPPIAMLLRLDDKGTLQASDYARYAKQANLDLVTWTLESGDITSADNWMYATLPGFMHNEAQTLLVLDALATKVGIKGIFSDWPGTVTYYANCMAN